METGSSGLLFLRKSKEGNISTLLDRRSQSSLMTRTISREAPGNDFSSFREKPLQRIDILVINRQLLRTKATTFFPLERSGRCTHQLFLSI